MWRARDSNWRADAEAKIKDAKAAEAAALRESIADWKREIRDLRDKSYLMGGADPFIVLPTTMFGRKTGFTPGIGDYCVVIVDGAIYPGIVGDAGPMAKMGEASLRICKEIEPKSGAEQRAENDLKVTYLVFPGSREKPFGPPNLDKWHARCAALLTEFGGYGGELAKWEVPVKPAPPATPAPATPPPAKAAPPATPSPAPPSPSTPAPETKPAPTP